MAEPVPSRVTVTGSVRPKFWQLRLVKDMLSRFAMKVNRLSPVPGTGVAPVASSVWLAARNGVSMLTMFWQYIAGLSNLLFAPLIIVWPTSARYKSVLAASRSPLPSWC